MFNLLRPGKNGVDLVFAPSSLCGQRGLPPGPFFSELACLKKQQSDVFFLSFLLSFV